MNQIKMNISFKNMLIKYQFVFIASLIFVSSFGQSVNLSDLSQYKNKLIAAPLYSIHGNISSNLMYTGGTNLGVNNTILWTANGNLELSLLNQIKVPVSLNLSTAGIGYKLPQSPSRINLKPVYKWIKGYIGSNNMSFSSYTLNGHLFSGIGFEMEPLKNNFKIAAMYGRLQKAVAYDSTNINFKSATYERDGYGAKIEYEKDKYNIGLSLFGAKDKYASLLQKPDSLGISPQQNFIISYLLTLKPVKGVLFNGEFATSLFTSDIRTLQIQQSTFDKIRNLGYNYRESTKKNHAFKMQVGYNIKKTMIGFTVERVDPGFQSLGSYFINNDLENFSLNYSKIFLNNKLTFSGNIGTQKDNLKHTKTSSSNRLLSSFNFNYNPKDKIFHSLNYSSFKSYMFVQPQFQTLSQLALAQYQNLDTLNFKQVSENAMYTMNYKLKSTESITRSFNFNFNYQNASNIQSGSLSPINSIDTKYYNSAFAYLLMLKSIGLKLNAVYNINYSTQGGQALTSTNGPTIAAFYSMKNKKLNLGATLSYNKTSFLTTHKNINIFINRISADYKIQNNSLRFDVMLQSRNGSGVSSFNSMGNLSYNMSF